MPIREIVQIGHSSLREKCATVTDLHSNNITQIIEDLIDTMRSHGSGIGIAAPQIGYSLRIFLVAGKIFVKDFAQNRLKKKEEKRLNENGFQFYCTDQIGGLRIYLEQNEIHVQTYFPFQKNDLPDDHSSCLD